MPHKLPKFHAITSDSRKVNPGDLYVAVRGTAQDGHLYIVDAIARGAVAVIGENPPHTAYGPNYIQVPSSRRALAELAAEQAGHPSRALQMIGVTGTSGKTTTTYILETIFKAAGRSVGVIGTVNTRYAGKVTHANLTTPGAPELQKLLAEMKAAGVQTVVMEVSSHALKQERVRGIAFDGVIFTNLSREHLDYHSDMEDYFQAKAQLFTEWMDDAKKAGKAPVAVINLDDEWGKRLGPMAEAHAAQTLACDPLFKSLETSLIGEFNQKNIACAATLAKALGISEKVICDSIRTLAQIPGRMEEVGVLGAPFRVVVDYAHKPDALEKVLKALRPLTRGKLICVFGCGGGSGP